MKDFTLLGVPLTLVHLSQLAILLGLADYVLDPILNRLRADIRVERLVKLNFFAELGEVICIAHLLLTNLEGSAMRMKGFEYTLNALDELVSLCDEISLARHFNHGDQLGFLVQPHPYVALGSGSPCALLSIGESSLSQKFLSLLYVSRCLSQNLQAILDGRPSQIS
jgi:hypothetical protein